MDSNNVMPYIDVMPSTMEQLTKFEMMFISEMENKNPLEIAIQLKAMEELISNLRANNKVRDYIMSEIDKYPEKSFKYQGATFEKAETGVKYDYSQCGDSVLNKLEEQSKKVSKELKERQKMLQIIKEPVANPETGEVINPALRTSNSYVKISLK